MIVVLPAGVDERAKVSASGQLFAWYEQLVTKTETSPCDAAEHLRTREEMAAYLEASIEEADGDTTFTAKALGHVSRTEGMSLVARGAGLSRKSPQGGSFRKT